MRIFTRCLILILFGLLPLAMCAQSNQVLSFSFTLQEPATVSAGLYNSNNILIRTIFNNKQFGTGTHSESFAALDDQMQPVTSTKGLMVRVLSNNVKYTWEGVIGNTSKEMTGSSVHHGYMSFYHLQVHGKRAYYSSYYSEGYPTQNMFSLDNIQQKTSLFPNEPKGVGQATAAIAIDDHYVYWAGRDPSTRTAKFSNYVFATTLQGNDEVDFAKGKAYKNGIGRTYKSVIDYTNDESLEISGVAVQKKGSLLFVAHGSALHVLDKKSGALLSSIKMRCSALAVDANDNLWLVSGRSVKKITVSANGKVNGLISIDHFSDPVAVSVSPGNGTVVIADAGNSQQLKAFDNFSGKPVWTLGEEGGYYKSAAVKDDKFYFSDSRLHYGVSISFEKDGSFWLVDGGNYRVLHFDAGRRLLERMMYLPHHYNVYADKNAPHRVFADFLEFRVNYTKPLKPGNGSWEFVRNWGAVITGDLFHKSVSFMPMKLPNGRTYSMVESRSSRMLEAVELTQADTLRFTGSQVPAINGTMMGPGGALYFMPRKQPGKAMVFTKREITGFDKHHNPAWGSSREITRISRPEEADPTYSGNEATLRPGEITSNGILLVFNGNSKSQGFHLGGVLVKDNTWAWRTARATQKNYQGNFPADGSYDIGNRVQYGGNVAMAIGSNIFWGYHGEFWKGSQTNKWNHLYQNGLMLGQFGVTGIDVLGEEAAAGMAGNVISGSVVQVDNAIYLYHNDEGHHSGIHRWKATNLESIKEQQIPVALMARKEIEGKKKLMKDLPFNRTLENGMGGWIREPLREINADYHRDWWSVKTNATSHDQFEDADIYARFRQLKPGHATLKRSLGNNDAANWTLSGALNLDGTVFNKGLAQKGKDAAGGLFFEVLDDKDRVVFRFFPQLGDDGNTLQVVANHVVLAEDEVKLMERILGRYQDFVLDMKNDKLTFRYGKYKKEGLAVFDRSANGRKPSTVRFYFWTADRNVAQVIAIKDFSFSSNN